MTRQAKTATIGYCLRCGRSVPGDLPRIFAADPKFLTAQVRQCAQCADRDVVLLRMPRVPRYQCKYLSSHGSERGDPFGLRLEDIHFCATAEAYELFSPDAWNGFKEISTPDDIPALFEVSVPSDVFRQSFTVDVLLLIISLIASGVIGGISYEILKDQARKLWQRVRKAQRRRMQRVAKEAPVQGGDDFDRVFDSSFVYLSRRLVGLEELSAPDGLLFRAARLLARKSPVNSREFAAHLPCSHEDGKALLKLLGAGYSLSTRKWHLREDLQAYYAGRWLPESDCQRTDLASFFVHDAPNREVAWSVGIPKPTGLSEDEAMDFDAAVLQATTPDTEAFLRGEISEQELQRRVKVKAGILAESSERRRKGSR